MSRQLGRGEGHVAVCRLYALGYCHRFDSGVGVTRNSRVVTVGLGRKGESRTMVSHAVDWNNCVTLLTLTVQPLRRDRSRLKSRVYGPVEVTLITPCCHEVSPVPPMRDH